MVEFAVTEELLNGDWFAWRENYGLFSVSPRDKNRTIAYIKNQKQLHSNKDLWRAVEYFDEDDEFDAG